VWKSKVRAAILIKNAPSWPAGAASIQVGCNTQVTRFHRFPRETGGTGSSVPGSAVCQLSYTELIFTVKQGSGKSPRQSRTRLIPFLSRTE
jgi:hypothetical protein